MYKVYADDILIHDAKSPSHEIHLIDPNLSLADSSAGSFTFTMTLFNVGYDDIKRFTTTIIVYKDSNIIWTGRVITQTDDFWHRRKFTCEGALAFLNDSIQPLQYYKNVNSDTFFTTILNNHNARVPSNRQVQVGTITMHDQYDPYNYKTEYKNTFDTIKTTLFDVLGGHFRVRYDGNNPTPIIDYLDDYPNTSSQQINFGKNLLEFTKNWDLSNLCTIILPRGKQLEEENDEGDKDYLTIKSVNNNSMYLQNDSAVETFGSVERVVDFSEVDNPTTLKLLGQRYLQELQFDDMILEVSAVDLHLLSSETVSFNLLDEVRCISAPHGLDRLFPISQIDIPLDKPDSVKYTMGTKENTSMSSQSVSSGKQFQSQLQTGLAATLSDAKRNAALIINSATTGYVNIITENEHSEALVITNTPDIANATKLWRYNLNGLGYSSDGGETYDIAMTMDGVIVADFIRTGIIDDGHGYNRWNLTTGEFQMAYNTEVANALGNTITVLDIVELAQDGVDTATDAMHKQSGGTNLLNGTNKNLKTPSSGNSNWSDGTWDGNVGPTATKRIVDISGAPNSTIIKGLYIELLSNSTNQYTGFTQRNVQLTGGQVYVMSCYAKGTASKISLYANFTGSSASEVNISDLTNSWRRYSYAFKLSDNANSADIVFAIVGNARTNCYICGMQLERGNTASDWSESDKESYEVSTASSAEYTDAKADQVKTYSKQYTDTISENDRAFTKQQRQALDESLTQREVLKRLTKNFTAKGIYLTNNELYMNASYVRTGTLDAGIIKAGILTDSKGNNKWNMATGYLYTKNMEAQNMRATGAFECGSNYKVKIEGGAVYGYQGNTCTGRLSPTADIRWVPTGRIMQGMQLRGKDIVEIRSPKFGMRNANDDGVSIVGETKRVAYNVVEEIRDRGNGSISWSWREHGFDVLNGIIISIW